MKNKEVYVNEVMDIVPYSRLAVSKETNRPCKCCRIGCDECLFGFGDGYGCETKAKEWLEAEYVGEKKVTNYEAYKEDIINAIIATSADRDDDNSMVFDKTNKRMSICFNTRCADCIFNETCVYNYDGSYEARLREWMNEEFKG